MDRSVPSSTINSAGMLCTSQPVLGSTGTGFRHYFDRWLSPGGLAGLLRVIRNASTISACFRSSSKSGAIADLTASTLGATTGLMHCSKSPSLDHLIGEREQSIGNRYVERVGGLQADYQLVLVRRLNRELSRISTFENTIDVRGHAPKNIVNIGAI